MIKEFKSGEAFLLDIQKGNDYYNVDTGEYVFVYNDSGSICTYYLTLDEAIDLEKKSREHNGEYWGAFLGIGGEIIDDPSYEHFEEGDYTNLDYCNETYKEGRWYSCKDILAWEDEL